MTVSAYVSLCVATMLDEHWLDGMVKGVHNSPYEYIAMMRVVRDVIVAQQALPLALVPPIQPALSNVLTTITGEHISTSVQSLDMSIDLHIDDNINSPIHNNAFVNVRALLFDAYRNDITDDQTAWAYKPHPVPNIQTMDQWFEGFHIYVAIYTNVHNFPTSALIKYSNIIQVIARRASLVSAMFYDENFRKWHQHRPSLKWVVMNNELLLHSSAMGMVQ